MRDIKDWRTTLPIPVPSEVRWDKVTINGVEGYLLADSTGLGSAVVWHDRGRVNAVFGTASGKAIEAVAASLR